MPTHSPLSAGAERERLVRAAADQLRSDGWLEVRASGCAGFRRPQALVVPVLQVPLQPDLCASHPRRRGPLLGVVATSRDIGEASLRRRCEALAAWAREHGGEFVVFVPAHDEARARAAVTARWHLDPMVLRALRSPPPPTPAPGAAQPRHL
ncbi:hypothetical protein SVA_1745 [Sulfurifustis variabilis]|uniref:Uncharacterized protein n=1 Tax=Sulfurifustis variabilis TaxID=1675686 RepID=A0A1B4V459_9GAMM|nr:hypothetical protein [Sulfurifustis variabilis]BAU48299.1 hypothetical protein SVA_1745 [Sulfurifustis variabilis]